MPMITWATKNTIDRLAQFRVAKLLYCLKRTVFVKSYYS